jgi:hypothetical protein
MDVYQSFRAVAEAAAEKQDLSTALLETIPEHGSGLGTPIEGEAHG